ncbi:LuxR C-terminal-related transcriptional regulator [Dactylosporangium cerinum]|uniref:LuxR C-terminal-related transcriptional regulator n=1 Tax=Dactylosporangium cerinum TaxID=1434730 RepID=A0ABV9W4J4_9ACTN
MLEVLGLGATAETVYRAMLQQPGLGVAPLADALGVTAGEVRAALDELFELSLLRESVEHEGQLRAVNPGVGLQALLARQQAELERKQLLIAQSQTSVATLMAQYAERPVAALDAERLVGLDAVQARLEELAQGIRMEALSLLPGAALPAPGLAAAHRNNTDLLARGITIRTVMQDSARNDRPTLAYAQSLTDAGAEVRTAPVLPPRMLIADRRVAIVPIDPEDTGAGVVQLTGSGVVASLVTLFEQVWSTAVPLGASRARDRKGVTAQEAELLKLLSQGHTDESAAKRLGLSERSARRMMADLMERLGARSRFEAGLLAAREGWL